MALLIFYQDQQYFLFWGSAEEAVAHEYTGRTRYVTEVFATLLPRWASAVLLGELFEISADIY